MFSGPVIKVWMFDGLAMNTGGKWAIITGASVLHRRKLGMTSFS